METLEAGSIGGIQMETAINRVMSTYTMLVNLTAQEERDARLKVTAFLSQSKTQDENLLAVEGIKFLRGDKVAHRRRSGTVAAWKR